MAYGEVKNLGRDTVLIEHIWEFEHIAPSEGVRTKDWKYFRYVNDKSFEELYDLRADPQETSNLAKDEKHKDVLEKFRKKCDQLIALKSDEFAQGPSDLSVVFKKPPMGKAILPNYGWSVPNHIDSQSAYQILVASSKENLDNNIGDVWNSGRVGDSFHKEIAHMGKRLEKGKDYYWKVRIYDEDNRLSDYSKLQGFVVNDSLQL